MRFAKAVFWIAGIYGVIVTAPLFFTEQILGEKYPPIVTHAEYYYSFGAIVVFWQIIFFIIARNPAKYRILMPFCVGEKLCMLPAFFIMYPQGRYPDYWFPLLAMDLILGTMFFISYRKTKTVQE